MFSTYPGSCVCHSCPRVLLSSSMIKVFTHSKSKGKSYYCIRSLISLNKRPCRVVGMACSSQLYSSSLHTFLVFILTPSVYASSDMADLLSVLRFLLFALRGGRLLIYLLFSFFYLSPANQSSSTTPTSSTASHSSTPPIHPALRF
jgi:hypothetical protein